MFFVEFLFWIALALLLFTYAGYPLLLVLLAPIRPKPVIRPGVFEPTVSFLVAARNEARHIEAKIRNIAELDYPPERLEVLVLDDGSSDATAELTRQAFERYLGGGRYWATRVVSLGAPQGKAAALNRGGEEARGDVLVLSDADCLVNREAVRLLVKPFVNPIVGCVAGRYVAGGVQGRNAGGVGLYWRYEGYIRTKESESGGLLGASGALYALRRDLYPVLRPGLVNDDFVVPITVSLRGFRTLYEPNAVAVEDESRNVEVEFRRRVRIMVGNCQHVLLFREYFSGKRGQWRLLAQMVCHKFLRVVSPLWLILAGGTGIALASSPSGTWLGTGVYRVLLMGQILCYLLAAAGFFFQGSHRFSKLMTLPYYFVMLNAAAFLGMWHFLVDHGVVTWGAPEAKDPLSCKECRHG
ncbi:MAG TPA: glycosyltransferase family 2 protein [Candidatus Sumerlaeota bacterium]|nr:glycosyltransferase family 2 protein [Candidatus Sumerlaeota bacterium]